MYNKYQAQSYRDRVEIFFLLEMSTLRLYDFYDGNQQDWNLNHYLYVSFPSCQAHAPICRVSEGIGLGCIQSQTLFVDVLKIYTQNSQLKIPDWIIHLPTLPHYNSKLTSKGLRNFKSHYNKLN